MLYVCATPIGNLDDVSPRVAAALREADLIAAEDTRHTRKLLARLDAHTPLTSLFAHNEEEKTAYVLSLLRAGRDVALVSDAGMPGISDPGLRLIARAAREGVALTVLPGPSAVTTALAASGLARETGFRFVGYLPRRGSELLPALAGWRRCGGVVVAFETGRRLGRSLAALAYEMPEAPAAVCRELTKVHEEVARGELAELAARFSGEVKGEITLVVDLGDPPSDDERDAEAARAAATSLLDKGLSRRDAAAALTVCLGLPANQAKRLIAAIRP